MRRGVRSVNSTVRDKGSWSNGRKRIDDSTSSDNNIVQAEESLSFNAESPDMRPVYAAPITKFQKVVFPQLGFGINEHVLPDLGPQQAIIKYGQ